MKSKQHEVKTGTSILYVHVQNHGLVCCCSRQFTAK